MMDQLNLLAAEAAGNEAVREKIILQQEGTILRTASLVCRRFITKSDDEWSVALLAFSNAVDTYTVGRGDFLPYAKTVIRSRLTDHFRTQKHLFHEVVTAPYILEGGGTPEEDTDGVYRAVVNESLADRAKTRENLREEILEMNTLLKTYGFQFFDLTACSPKQDRKRADCAAVIRYLLGEPNLIREMKQQKKLPVKALVSGSGISRKTIDRYRKYIIMAVLVLQGEYPMLSEYLRFVRQKESL